MHARHQFWKLADPTSIETARYIAKRGILRRGALLTHLRNFPTPNSLSLQAGSVVAEMIKSQVFRRVA
jgi:hypothetical protein